jgi:hypothetical protein
MLYKQLKISLNEPKIKQDMRIFDVIFYMLGELSASLQLIVFWDMMLKVLFLLVG